MGHWPVDGRCQFVYWFYRRDNNLEDGTHHTPIQVPVLLELFVHSSRNLTVQCTIRVSWIVGGLW
jgi:hypothetical protein